MSLTKEQIQQLDAQIDASNDVSPEDKASRREMLRRLFHLGNECRRQGASEEFLRQRIPHESVPIMAGGWDVVPKRIESVMKLWKIKGGR